MLVRSSVRALTFASPFADLRRAVVSNLRKHVYFVLVYWLGGLSLPRNSVVRLTGCPDMTIVLYRVRKASNNNNNSMLIMVL